MPRPEEETVGTVWIALLTPLLILAVALFMETVERPIRQAETDSELETFLETAKPEEVETLVSEGYASALDRYWRRRRRGRK